MAVSGLDAATRNVITRVAPSPGPDRVQADPITAEVVRHGLNSAANQMRLTLLRTSVTPLIYEIGDCAIGLYDSQYRMLGQAPGLPIFMGTLGFCVEAAVRAVGGPSSLSPEDIVLFNIPYETGSHPQDIAMVRPVFVGDELVGYAALKAHVADIGAKDPYSTDTADIFQEGTLFPGVMLSRGGHFVRDVYQTLLANSRLPRLVEGDVNAMINALWAGDAALKRLIARHGMSVFRASIERVFDHAEAFVRDYVKHLPDGRFSAVGTFDDNGIENDPVPVEITVEIDDSTIRVDYTNVPDAQSGPLNSPLAGTVSAARIAVFMLAGGLEAPNEGHFRPIEVITRPGSMFHPLPPSPCYLCHWAAQVSIEIIYRALAQDRPDMVPAASGGDHCDLCLWGYRDGSGEWGDYLVWAPGHGASRYGDGANATTMNGNTTCRTTPVEVAEARNPTWIFEKNELAPDSGGAGKHRGGLGHDVVLALHEDTYLTGVIERSKTSPWGLSGGHEGRKNDRYIRYPDGTHEFLGKSSRHFAPKGSIVESYLGGGGGYGDPAERDPAAIENDLRQGYITQEAAVRLYSYDGHDRSAG